MVRSHIKLIGAFGLIVAWLSPFAVRAQSAELVGQVSEFGRLSKKDARSVVDDVSEKIKRAADAFVGMNHPIRRSMRMALFGSAPLAPAQEAINDAKARLYLYGGLTPQSLSALFKPGPNAVITCVNDFVISEKWCEALLAASARKSVAEIRRANATARAPVAVQTAATATPPATPMGSSLQPTPVNTLAPRAVSAAPMAPATASSPGARAPTHMVAATAPVYPVAVAKPVQQAPVASGPSTAEQYKASRAKYLASFKDKGVAAESAKSPAGQPKASPASTSASVKPTTVKPAPTSPSSPATAQPSIGVAAARTGESDQGIEVASASKESAAESSDEPKQESGDESKKSNKALDPLISDLLADPLSKGKSAKSK